MSVSLMMGWALLALLVLLVVVLFVVTLISGSASPATNRQSPGQEVPVNVFQRGMPAVATGGPVPAFQPVPAYHPDLVGQSAAHPTGPRRWYPGMGAAQAPLAAQAPMAAPAPWPLEVEPSVSPA